MPRLSFRTHIIYLFTQTLFYLKHVIRSNTSVFLFQMNQPLRRFLDFSVLCFSDNSQNETKRTSRSSGGVLDGVWGGGGAENRCGPDPASEPRHRPRGSPTRELAGRGWRDQHALSEPVRTARPRPDPRPSSAGSWREGARGGFCILPRSSSRDGGGDAGVPTLQNHRTRGFCTSACVCCPSIEWGRQDILVFMVKVTAPFDGSSHGQGLEPADPESEFWLFHFLTFTLARELQTTRPHVARVSPGLS